MVDKRLGVLVNNKTDYEELFKFALSKGYLWRSGSSNPNLDGLSEHFINKEGVYLIFNTNKKLSFVNEHYDRTLGIEHFDTIFYRDFIFKYIKNKNISFIERTKGKDRSLIL